MPRSTTTSSDERNPVELLAEEFLDRKRRGEQPTLREYLERHPELAEEIRDLFPALLMMEDLGEDSGGTTGSLAADNGAALGMRLQRLGDYRILREIGRGGMGVVYEAEQESLGRRVALKVLSAGSLLDPKQVRRFEREAKAAARLHHTNIVPVFGVGRQDGLHYFVMQFIAGLGLDVVLDDLRRLRRPKDEASPAPSASGVGGLTGLEVARSLVSGRFDADLPPEGGSVTEPVDGAARAVANGPAANSGTSSPILPGSSELSLLDPDRAFYRSVARIGIQVADALEYANRQGILHRDVKPSNLLLDNHGNVWVADFGLAKTDDADDLTHTGDVLGTIRYMAPERFSGHCDARSDVYSLGLTLYELVALKPAFEASDRHALMDRVLHEEPERLKTLSPGVPRDLETIVAKATAREPVGRYATAAALAEDLRRYVEDRPIRARRISPAERFARWCRRNKVLAAAIGVAAAALLVVAVLSMLYADRQARHAALQTEANKRITRLASALENESGALRNERGRLEIALAVSNSRLARLDLERGQAAFEKGQIGVGMLWTVESLRMAVEAGDEAGQHVALANLSAWRRHQVELKAVFTHGNAVDVVAFSPDGKSILTGGNDNTARLWDAATGRIIGQPMKHSEWVISAAFSPDGNKIVTGGADKSARLWDAATGRPTGQPMKHSEWVFSVAFSPDAKTILTGSLDKTARRWDAATGLPKGEPLAHSNMVYAVAFSPDCKTIVTGSHDNTVRLWDAATGRPIGQRMEYSGSGTICSVVFSPDGKRALTGSTDKTARQWDTATGQPIGRPMEHRASIRSVTFSPDGNTILTGCDDNTAQLWDAATGVRMGRAIEHQYEVWSVAFSPDGRSILTGSADGMARIWDGDVGQHVGRPLDLGGQVRALAFCPDRKALLACDGDGNVRLWDVASGHPLGQTVELGTDVSFMDLSPDRKTIVTGSYDSMWRFGNVTRLWDAATGRPVGSPMEHTGTVTSVAFSPDGKMVLTGSRDKTARLWDAATGHPLCRPMEHSQMVYAVAFSPDSQTTLTGSLDNTARLWDVATGRPKGSPIDHSMSVMSVAFSPDGKTVLTGCYDKTARLWDSATRRPIGRPLVHSGWVSSVSFSADGKTILTGSSDNVARLWDAAGAQPIGPAMPHPSLPANGGVKGVSFTADGRFLLTHDRSAAWLWNASVPIPGDVPRLAAWVEAATGLELDERGSIHVLDRSAWLERRRRLEQLGGAPPADAATRLDPILFGGNAAARGDGWKERGMWDQAEAAYAEAIRARPLSTKVWLSLARLHVERGDLAWAASTVLEAVRLMPDDLILRHELSRALLWAGDWVAWRRSNAALLDRFGTTSNPHTARMVARACVLGPDATADPEVQVRLAEAALLGSAERDRAAYLGTLGTALYRAGRFEDAIRRLDETNQLQGGESSPVICTFLALAHHRLGHPVEARRWLDRLRARRPSSDPAEFWPELQVRLHLREAEAVILYDPVFPVDPFAR